MENYEAEAAEAMTLKTWLHKTEAGCETIQRHLQDCPETYRRHGNIVCRLSSDCVWIISHQSRYTVARPSRDCLAKVLDQCRATSYRLTYRMGDKRDARNGVQGPSRDSRETVERHCCATLYLNVWQAFRCRRRCV